MFIRVTQLFFLFILLQASSCHKKDPVLVKNSEGIITDKPYFNLASVSDNPAKVAVLGVANHVFYKRGVMLPGVKNDDKILKMIDVDTGELLWEWNDPVEGKNYDAINSYINSNFLFWNEGRELYCINLNNGATVWKKRYDSGEVPAFFNVNGIGNIFFITASYSPYIEDEVDFVKIYKTTVATGPEITEVVRVLSNNLEINHGPGEIGAFENSEGDTLLFFDTYDVSASNQGYFNLYNLTQKEWVYKKKDAGDLQGGVATPQLYDGVVYMAMNPHIVAVDLMSGDVVWEKEFTNAGFYTSGFILIPEKNLIVFNAEAGSTTLYALDLITGAEVWSEPSSGTSSHLQYLNGVVYFVGGGDGWLHAVDVDTGKHLWKIVSPDEAVNSNAFFTRYCAVFPGQNGEKGKVVVSSGLHAFAYEAER